MSTANTANTASTATTVSAGVRELQMSVERAPLGWHKPNRAIQNKPGEAKTE